MRVIPVELPEGTDQIAQLVENLSTDEAIYVISWSPKIYVTEDCICDPALMIRLLKQMWYGIVKEGLVNDFIRCIANEHIALVRIEEDS